MSMHFSANQYEQSFRAPHLGNWEVGKWYPHERPRARRGHTKIIADDRGHLLPGVPRIAPWGHFKSTWQLPKRITRKLARDIGSARQERKLQTTWEKRSSHHPLIEQETTTPPLLPPTNKEKKTVDKKEIPIVEEKSLDSKDLGKDEHDYTNPVGHDRTPKVIDTAKRVREDIESYSKTCRLYPEKKNLLEKLVSRNSDEKTTSNRQKEYRSDEESIKSNDRFFSLSKHSGSEGPVKSFEDQLSSRSKDSKKTDSPNSLKSVSPTSSKKSQVLEADFISAQYARDLAQNNLKHRPLPDVVEDKLFQALQMQQVKNPGAELHNIPTAAAVGHKKYISPGPTQCSKLKVYRPKTAAPKKLQKRGVEERPKTSRAKDLQEIDLAICWDLTPRRPEDEPKRPIHIDGSNGSVAPGIFTVVKPHDQEMIDKKSLTNTSQISQNGYCKPKAAWPEINEKSKPVNPSAVMDIINNNTDELQTKKPTEHNPSVNKKSGEHKNNNKLVPINGSQENKSPNVPSSNASSKNSRNGSAHKGSQNNTLDTSINSDKLKHSPKARSSPNLSSSGEEKQNKNKLFYSRPCMACDTKTPLEFATKQLPREEYKMAFKAGVPNSRNSSNNGSQSSNMSKPLNVPKPKTPFARKSYSINTLAPPFSLWPGTTGMDYPEHWRLASVYQQSYKPIELRKNPMIRGIFR